jgi:uncharacterized protein YaiI (UPF0178 family)
MPTILVDADGCPVVDETIRVASHFGLKVQLFCDTSHMMQRDGAETVMVSKGMDAVDFVLVNKVKKGDIVVTQDYGLAAMVLAKKGYAINQNGRFYTEENIDRLLSMRHVSKKVRQAGGRTNGPKKRQREDDLAFIESLTRLCERLTNSSANEM